MNENEYYWEDRLLDVLKQFAPALVGGIVDQILHYRSDGGMVAPVLRLAVNLDRPDLIAPLLPDRGDGPSLEDVTWENEELVRLLMRRDAKERFGDKPLLDFVRGMDAPGAFEIDGETLRDVYHEYRYAPTLLPAVINHCPSLDQPAVDGQAVWLEILEALLATGVIAGDNSGQTWRVAFESAVSDGRLEAVELFLKHGASPNLRIGTTYILMTALKRQEIYDVLVAAGGKLAWDAADVFYNPALGMAIQDHAIGPTRDMFADAIASGNLSTNHLNRFLGQAARSGSIEIVRLFLDAGADIDTAFSRSFFYTYTDRNGNEEKFGNIDMLRFLLDSGAPVGDAICEAAWQENRQAVAWLIERGGDIDMQNREGKTALMVAASRYDYLGEMLDFILEMNPDINIVDSDGSTALSLAVGCAGLINCCKEGKDEAEMLTVAIENIAVIKRLLDIGADPNDGFGMTPLMIAAESNCPELIPLLLAAGADVSAMLEDGDTAWRIANSRGHHDIAKMLEEAGAREPDQSRTDLRSAILWGHTDDALRLIAEGADTEQKDVHNRTPLLMALMEDGDTAIVEYLLEKGANPSYFIPDPDGHGNNSPLLQAVELRRPHLVRMLLAHGAHKASDGNAWLALARATSFASCSHLDEEQTPEDRANAMDISRQLLEAGVPPDDDTHDQITTTLHCAASKKMYMS